MNFVNCMSLSQRGCKDSSHWAFLIGVVFGGSCDSYSIPWWVPWIPRDPIHDPPIRSFFPLMGPLFARGPLLLKGLLLPNGPLPP
jgi:hypothetical protein